MAVKRSCCLRNVTVGTCHGPEATLQAFFFSLSGAAAIESSNFHRRTGEIAAARIERGDTDMAFMQIIYRRYVIYCSKTTSLYRGVIA